MTDPGGPSDLFDADGFAALWPTRLMKRSLPGATAANKELLRLILAADKGRADMTTDYLAGNFLTQKNPAVDWLRQCINKTVIDYLKASALAYQVDWTLQGWANVNRLGDYHDPHNHPHSYLSGTYYVQMPERQERLKTRSDVRPGAISFYDPRGQANMTAIRSDPNIEAEFTLKPEAGTILLWPAFLLHFVHPNLSQQPRVSISFNVVLKWRDDYLPQQE
jgi:uncharacterized protein (TIGR02466 family)